MRITDVNVGGFGVWSGVSLDELSPGVTVFYGPNEAGKSTLLEFIRGVFYGFGESRRRRYLPPVHGGDAGGSLHVSSIHGDLDLIRHGDLEAAGGDDLMVAAPDGTLQGDHFISSLLADVDEPIFNNVFAVGLRELQELGTLGDTEAARLLYSLTSGLDRVSLVDVIRELTASRERLLSADDRPSLIVQLLGHRERLEHEIEELGGQTRRWARLAQERRGLEAEVTAIEAENQRLQASARAVEAAIAVRSRWQQRAAIDVQLAGLAAAAEMTDDALDRLDAVTSKLSRRLDRYNELRSQRRDVRREAAALDVNELLWRQAPRIEALGEQREWVASIERQIQELEAEVATLQSQCQVERRGLGLGENDAALEPIQLDERRMARLRPRARAVREAKRRVAAAEQQQTKELENASAADVEVSAALAALPENDLQAALETAGNRVAQLRRRVQIDERIGQMERSRSDLEQQSLDLLDRQLMPVWVVIGLGGVFVLGVLMIFVQFILPGSVLGSIGWALAILGLCATAGAGLTKFLLERSAAGNLDSCHKQIGLLERQLEQAKAERASLDGELPPGGGPLVSRLQTAERELSTLEELLPLETRRQTAIGEAASAEQRLAAAREQYGAARKAWHEALSSIGLPAGLTPKQVSDFSGRSGQIGELERTLARRREELQQRRHERETISLRVTQLMADLDLEPVSPLLVEQIRQLAAAAQAEEAKTARRDILAERAKELRREQARYSRSITKLRRRRQTLLEAAGVSSEEEYRRRAEQHGQVKQLRAERDGISREISAVLAGQAGEEEVGRYLSDDRQNDLEALWEQVSGTLESNGQRQKQMLQNQGELAAELKSLAGDRRHAASRLELDMVEQRLADAVDAWRVRAVTSLLFDELRREFEQNRQPETLREASTYLARLTGGHYSRVWTPLGEEVLYVDDDTGRSLPIDILSRGTREQLFLSLRLALVALYARRGVSLPLVLDDVLVNFDIERAKAAAKVLREFAKDGHQVLLFTCHEHIWKMFKAMKMDARRLPDHAGLDGEAEEIAEEEELPEELVAEEEGGEEKSGERRVESGEPEEDWDGIEEDEFEEEEEVEAEFDEEEESGEEGEFEEEEEVEYEGPHGARGWEVEFEDELNELEGGSQAA